MGTIKLDVGDEPAAAFERLTDQGKAAFTKAFSNLLGDQRSLFQVMDDISEYVKKQGMRDETLKGFA